MRKQKRFDSEQEILKAIDDCHAKAKALHAEADEHNEKARVHAEKASLLESQLGQMTAKEQDVAWAEIAGHKNWYREAKAVARKRQESATRLIDVKAVKLGRTLAAFRTEPMAILGEDHAVVMAR